MDDLARLLSELVAIPSVNPMGRAISRARRFFETRLTAYLEQWLGGLGVRLERHAVAPGRDNLLAGLDKTGSRRRLRFDVHQDTVPVGGMTIPPFVPTIERGRLYGRGSCDVKGSMAAMLLAFARLVRRNTHPGRLRLFWLAPLMRNSRISAHRSSRKLITEPTSQSSPSQLHLTS